MYSAPQLAAKYIHYYLTASNGKGHGIHSPFVFDFITRVLNDNRDFPAYSKTEACRKKLLRDKRVLSVQDFGAGSVKGSQQQRSVDSIARNALKSKKLGQFLFRIAYHYRPTVMVELGTSLGISAAYLAMGNPSAKIITCEGAAAIAAVAIENFNALQLQQIETVTGNFDDTLPIVLNKISNLQLVFIDGNHRKAPTLRYFESCLQKITSPAILIFDDIHWSPEMEDAWREIKSHPSVMLTIDLFFMGLVFFNKDFKVKQDFVVRF